MSKKSTRNVIIVASALIFIVLSIFSYSLYVKYLASNTSNNKKVYLYIPTNATYQNVLDSIKKGGFLPNEKTFIKVADEKSYKNKIKPGRYGIEPGMNNRAIINMLIAGNQEPVNVSFQNIRLKGNFCKFISKKLELDSSQLIQLLDSETYIQQYGFNKENIYTLFIPNEYEIFWNTNADEFFKRMHKEYQLFWNKERLAKANALNLTPQQVSILASIVDSEALMDNEMPKIAGLYLNRLNKRIKLEADPTVIFANNDFTIRRVLNKHLRKESPYNTYLNQGLPPGPISMPSIKAIDAVLNHDNNDYIYMCAKEDFSGYHNFSASVTEHLKNAKKFQEALNKRNIKK